MRFFGQPVDKGVLSTPSSTPWIFVTVAFVVVHITFLILLGDVVDGDLWPSMPSYRTTL